jgi:hypothetical protein
VARFVFCLCLIDAGQCVIEPHPPFSGEAFIGKTANPRLNAGDISTLRCDFQAPDKPQAAERYDIIGGYTKHKTGPAGSVDYGAHSFFAFASSASIRSAASAAIISASSGGPRSSAGD